MTVLEQVVEIHAAANLIAAIRGKLLPSFLVTTHKTVTPAQAGAHTASSLPQCLFSMVPTSAGMTVFKQGG